MISRVHGKVVFECDECAEVLETDMTNWDAAAGHARREGWAAERVAGVWMNYCPDCAQGQGSVRG